MYSISLWDWNTCSFRYNCIITCLGGVRLEIVEIFGPWACYWMRRRPRNSENPGVSSTLDRRDSSFLKLATVFGVCPPLKLMSKNTTAMRKKIIKN